MFKMDYDPPAIYTDPKSRAQVICDRVLTVQVCVPEDWTDEVVVSFAEEWERASGVGRNNPAFSIRRGVDKEGNPERNPCDERDGFVHAMLLA